MSALECDPGVQLCRNQLIILVGLQFDDQGLVNTDPRTIAVPLNSVNMIAQTSTASALPATPSHGMSHRQIICQYDI